MWMAHRKVTNVCLLLTVQLFDEVLYNISVAREVENISFVAHQCCISARQEKNVQRYFWQRVT
jgi:hypothetical protein